MHVTFFFFNDTATTEIYTLSLHDALPISVEPELTEWVIHEGVAERMQKIIERAQKLVPMSAAHEPSPEFELRQDRKSTRLNSSHSQISYAVFCLKKKKSTQSRCCLCYQFY